jgi:hypothetical protein
LKPPSPTIEPILLYGDYDVDGTTAVVLLKTAIEMLGGEARFHVPHRLREGYGLQSSVLESAYALTASDSSSPSTPACEPSPKPKPRAASASTSSSPTTTSCQGR